ncbi:IclR family transcriptional regulator C-terminal domain-containing protein [Qipengyuania sp. NPDC077410]|uniref:IclR family transcriptional regulator domain-containing protein n=1 Tax=Qipengyuania sp. NPDC077410 TaxID=3364496 RepID=UPI0037C8B17F
MTQQRQDKEFVDGLARGLKVIEAFDVDHAEMTLADVARRTALTPATARRSLHTLEQLGYVRCVNKRYLLAPKILSLGSAYMRVAHVEDSLLPELRSIIEKFGDAASVAVLTGPDILYVAHWSEQGGLRPMAGTGVTYPAYATSMGRVLLSGLSSAQLDRYLADVPLRKLTDVTETDPDRLRAVIQDIRKSGHAIVVDQLAYGVTSLAVPILLNGRRPVAAVNTSGYSGRVTPEQLVEERLPALRACATRLAEALLRYPALRHSLEFDLQEFGPADPQG